LDWTGLSDESRAEVGHRPVRLNQLLPERPRRVGIVFSVLVVLSERDSGFHLVGSGADTRFDAEAVERRERLPVKLGDRFGR
jgi:hypothetical protein